MEEVVRVLRSFPFDMDSEGKVELLARYLVEDPSHEQHVLFSQQKCQNFVVLKNRLIGVVGKYQLLDSKEQEED